MVEVAPTPVPAPVIDATPAPVVVAAPLIQAPPVVIETVSLEAVGLQMVETDPAKHASVAAAPAEKPVRQPRKPRIKPVVTEEPLQMIETHKD